MKSRTLTCITAMTLFAALATPVQLAAQQPKYRVIDLGTLGGPHSYGSVNGEGFSLLNNSGVVASFADLSVPDPNAAFFCFDPDCFQAHASKWKHGVITDLGALPGNNNSAAGSINARGWATGQSQTSTLDPVLGIPEFRGVLWKHGHIINLGTLDSGTESLGIYVNDAGQVIGFSTISTDQNDPIGFRLSDSHLHLAERRKTGYWNLRWKRYIPRCQLQQSADRNCSGRLVHNYDPEPQYWTPYCRTFSLAERGNG